MCMLVSLQPNVPLPLLYGRQSSLLLISKVVKYQVLVGLCWAEDASLVRHAKMRAASMLTSLVKVGLFGGRLDVSSQIHLLRAKIVSGLNNGRPIADHRHPRSSSAKKIYQTVFNNATRMIMGL